MVNFKITILIFFAFIFLHSGLIESEHLSKRQINGIIDINDIKILEFFTTNRLFCKDVI